MTEIKNAIIKSTSLGTEDHFILSAWVHLDYESGDQRFGGYALDGQPEKREPGYGRTPHANCGLFIARVLEVVGVDSWEKLPGKSVRVRADSAKVEAIGHFLKDEWFVPEEEFAKLRKKI